MREALDAVLDRVLERPRSVLAAALVVTAVAVWLGAGIELRTSRREMSPRDDPAQARWDALSAEFGEPEPLIVLLEGEGPIPDTDRLEELADRLAARLEARPEIRSVYYRLDAEWLLATAPWLMPPPQLEAMVTQAEALLSGPDGTPSLSGFADLNERLAARIQEALGRGDTLPARADADAAARLADLMAAERAFFESPAATAARVATGPALLAAAGERSITDAGYLATYSGDALFLLVQPIEADDGGGLAAERRLVDAVREVAEEVVGGGDGFRVALTGRPAMNVEEMETLARDGRNGSLVAILGVGLLSLAAFHSRRHALAGLAVLVMGVVWALGAVALELGYLNMITTALVPILAGIGIDYAVHPVSQFEVERRSGVRPKAAVRETFRKTGAAVAVSALTTAGVFTCLLFMEFRGFAELGLVAGGGVLLCLAAALVVLPALLLLVARPPDGGNEPTAIVDRIWTGRAAATVCRRPAATVAVLAVVTLAAGLAASGVGVDTSLAELMPPGAESLRTLERVADDSALGAWFNLVVSDDLQALRSLRDAADSVPEIARVEEPSRLLPADPEAAGGAVEVLAGFLERLRIETPTEEVPGREATGGDGPGRWTPGDEAPEDEASRRVAASLRQLGDVLGEAADTAFMAGLGAVAGELERARVEAEGALAAATAADPHEWRPAEDDLRQHLRQLRGDLLAAARARPPTLDVVPDPILSRFVTENGRFVAYLYPAGDVFDPDFLARFNAASRSLDADAIGFPVLFERQSRRITDGFGLAFAAAALVVLLLLAADLRRPSHVFLALVPVGVGVVWLLGAMRLLGLSFNLANLVAVPLVLGVGIDAGVHVLHRYRLERGAAGVRLVVEQTGRALLIASTTTMVGFGALSLAHHRGMASLGMLLFLGVGTCLVASLVLLPNLLLLVEGRRRRGSEGARKPGRPSSK